ncbi:MAG: redox-sensitive transcriptional activator SoxR [Gemmatimonadaceae bacterium]|nr:redox-sensitive transcriptional activator SoxR [Gemmatimonadaceae bacterium]MCW5827291.1 redox-sensitive transcriptional activator SoxR [Gemmatimonadaceae bacterium]
MQAPLLTIGELSRRTGVSTSALRFYEGRQLIRPQRSASGHRRYWRGTIRQVAFIVFAQRIGLSLDEVRREIESLAGRAPTEADWKRLSRRWTARIDKRMEELQRLRRGLSDCIGCGCLSLERCHILNPGDEAAARGAGPRFWLGDEPRESSE